MLNNLVRVILDTNVFVAAYWAPSSASARLLSACMDGKAQAQHSDAIRREVTHILHQIKLPEWYLEHIEQFWQQSEKVIPSPVTNIVADDPDDQKFLEAAVGGKTDFLVTNDDHLLRIKYIERTEIIPPSSAILIILE